MKHLLLAVFMMMTVPVFAGDKGNGGDPIRVYATDFPNKENLSAAYDIARSSLAGSQYMSEFNTDMLQELESLIAKDLIKYIPKEMVLLPDFSNYPYMVSVGAITELGKGHPIYLTKQRLDYSPKVLARVLLQELPHHVLTNGLERDETLINGLGQLIIDGVFEETVNKRLERTYYKNEFKIAQDLITYVTASTNCTRAASNSLCRCDGSINGIQEHALSITFYRYLDKLKQLPKRPNKFISKVMRKAINPVYYSGVDHYGLRYSNERCISVVELGDYINSFNEEN